MVEFAVWVGLGATLGLWRVARSSGRQSGIWVNVGLFLLMAALIGARLSFVLLNRAYFSSHPGEAPMLWLGGLTWPGAIFAVFLGLAFLGFAYRTPRTGKVSIGWIADRLYPLLPPVAITAWVGAWQDGAGYGGVVPAGAWWGLPAADETGEVLRRFPIQVVAAITLLLFFAILERRFRPLHPPGRISALAMIGLLTHLLIFSFLVSDPMPYWNGLRLDTWAALISLGLILAFVAVYPVVMRVGKKVRGRWVPSRT